MYGSDKTVADTAPANPTETSDAVRPSGLINRIQLDLIHLADVATDAARTLRELRQRTLGAWPENPCGLGAGREPASKSEEIADLIGYLRGQLLDVREQAHTLNQEI